MAERQRRGGRGNCSPLAADNADNADNADENGRWTDGAFDAHTCVVPYVWREACSGDDVRVTTNERSQAAAIRCAVF
ncbi:hypothetical protein [Nonomuraea sp. NEAU-A123]|uniref:hypothetical protein n=1 Tax=Nonomuraea sp. NEAU-A123 TaxID=2839649 RepID=UPI001BE4CC5E|nr:hypothetical protein [Nonomuraea sp. NEAU-A123]MBT2235443.1 hypothetical protein [Nonomuraea sp. NEAU-A123]